MAPNQSDTVAVSDDAPTTEATKAAETPPKDNVDSKSPSVESKSTLEQPQCTPQKAESDEISKSGLNGEAKIKDASKPKANAEEKKDASGEPADGNEGAATSESEPTPKKDDETTKENEKSDQISKDETKNDDDYGKTSHCGKRKDHPKSSSKDDEDDSKDEPQKKAKLFSFSSGGTTFGSTAFKFPSPATTSGSAFSFSSNSQFTFGKGNTGGTPSIFGTSSNATNTFANAAASSATPFTSTKSPPSGNDNPFSSHAAADRAATKPILPPPTSSPPRNGEEDETVRHQTRAKLYTGCPPSSNWKEVGIGPLRILTNKKNSVTRIVQRRESTPNGPGTKLILNVALKGSCNKVDRQAEKYVRLATAGEKGEIVMYLFRFSAVEAADELEKKLGEVLKECGGDGDDEGKKEEC